MNIGNILPTVFLGSNVFTCPSVYFSGCPTLLKAKVMADITATSSSCLGTHLARMANPSSPSLDSVQRRRSMVVWAVDCPHTETGKRKLCIVIIVALYE